MSRSHERAYRLLSERVQLSTWARRTLYTILFATFASGGAWLVVHYFPRLVGAEGDELRRLGDEALTLKLHGLAAFAVLLAIGAMASTHVRRAWTVRRNRYSGGVLVASLALLLGTGYALYYLVSDESRGGVSLAHWLVGLALPPLVVAHVILGRRTRAIASLAGLAKARPAARREAAG
jgi:hypothetical protein